MTTDARRADGWCRCQCGHAWTMHYERPEPTRSACAEPKCYCLVYKVDPAIAEAESRGIAKGRAEAWASAKRLVASFRGLTEGKWRKLDALFNAEIRATGGSVTEVVEARLAQADAKKGDGRP